MASSRSEFITPSRLVTKLQEISISAKYSVTSEFGFEENEKLTVIQFCENATNGQGGDFDVAKQIHANLETLQNCINYYWHVAVGKNEIEMFAVHHKRLFLTINDYKIRIIGFKVVNREKNILEEARKNISKLESTGTGGSMDNDTKDIIFKDEVKYAIKYCDSFDDIAKNISNELKNHPKIIKQWNVIVHNANYSISHCEEWIQFNLNNLLPILVFR